MITKKYYKLIRVSHEDSGYFYIKNISNEVGEFKFVKSGSVSSPNTEYSLDGVNWTSYDFTNLPTINVSSNIYLRSTSWTVNGGGSYFSIDFSKDYEIGGNILSIINYNDMTTTTTIGGNNQNGYLVYLFKNQTKLKSIEKLLLGNVNTITNSGGFYGPIGYMFYGCSSLEKGIDFSQVTTADGGAFGGLYGNCYKLNTMYAPNISSWVNNNFEGWMTNAGNQVTGTKTFYAPSGLAIPTGNSGIPSGWTRVDY